MELSKRVWLPVRCCCQPKKIFGFFQVPVNYVQKQEFEWLMADGTQHTIKLQRFNDVRLSRADILHTTDKPQYHEDRLHKSEKAVYSDDHPIEYWRQFHEFMEVR